MGAINYKTSNYVTLGYNLRDVERSDNYYVYEIEDAYEELDLLLEKQRFYYFNVSLTYGYYEGFTIDIECNFLWCFDNYREKLEAQKEVTKIKQFLVYAVNNYEINVIYPGWCTGYGDYKKTLIAINDGVKAMREDIKQTPTFYTLKIAGEI